jgi:uncharacterized coiled-coil protein SlyX
MTTRGDEGKPDGLERGIRSQLVQIVLLIAACAGAFAAVQSRVANLEERMRTLEMHYDVISTKLEETNARLGQMERTLTRLDEHMRGSKSRYSNAN